MSGVLLLPFFKKRGALKQFFFFSVLDPGFFSDPDRTFFLSPDRPKIRIRSGKIRIWTRIHAKKVQKLQEQIEQICTVYHILHSQHCSFWSGVSKTLSKTSFRSHKVVNGRIRTLKTRIRIGIKTRIHLDPKH